MTEYTYSKGSLPYTVQIGEGRVRFWCAWPEYTHLSGTATLASNLEMELDFGSQDDLDREMTAPHEDDIRRAVLWAVGEHYGAET